LPYLSSESLLPENGVSISPAILTFPIVHIHMTTTGHRPTAHVKAMITGWEEVEEGTPVEAWEQARPKGTPGS
jgi:hypothetical protein